MPKPIAKKPKPKQIEVGGKVTVVTEYTVKRIVEQEGVVLVAVDDVFMDRTLTFRKEELKLNE